MIRVSSIAVTPSDSHHSIHGSRVPLGEVQSSSEGDRSVEVPIGHVVPLSCLHDPFLEWDLLEPSCEEPIEMGKQSHHSLANVLPLTVLAGLSSTKVDRRHQYDRLHLLT